MLAHARTVGEYVRDRLDEVAAGTDRVGEVRGTGLFVGAEFVDDDGRPDDEAATAVQRRCYERGALVWTAGRHGNVFRLLPPLVITEELAETAMDVVTDVVSAVTAGQEPSIGR